MPESYREELDHKVFDVEILLISVVQGVALAAVAANAVPVFEGLKFEFYLYAVSALLIILTFWSQAIIHTLSFISWPMDMYHNFLYFIFSFTEVMAFSVLTDPQRWFTFIAVLFLIAGVLYIVDLQLIKAQRKKFQVNSNRKALFNHIQERQLFELKLFMPLGFLFNAAAAFLIYRYPKVFIDQHFHVVLIAIQVVFALAVLFESLQNFKKRSQLISEAK